MGPPESVWMEIFIYWHLDVIQIIFTAVASVTSSFQNASTNLFAGYFYVVVVIEVIDAKAFIKNIKTNLQ